MADDSGFGSADELQAEIERLQKEKNSLERKNLERQRLEMELKELRSSVHTLKATPSTSKVKESRLSDGGRSDHVSFEGFSPDLNSTLEESHNQLRTIQQSLLRQSPGVSVSLDTSKEDKSQDEDDVMTVEHKQALRQNRDVLVDNMIPDDIFNDMISKHILTNSDVSRIKEKNTVETMNEELLNILIRRSDRAFHVLVSSLRRTLQGWLANRLDPQTSGKVKRKRRTGEMNVNVECESVQPASKKRYTCTCQEVEEQILVMAKGAFGHIRRRDATPAAFEQFRKELQQTNEIIKDSMEIMHTLKILCRHGDLTDLTEGSVCFTVRCSSFKACMDLWSEFHSGSLLRAVHKGIITPSLLRICGARNIRLFVRLNKLEYLNCALELGQREMSRLLGSKRSLRSQRQKTGIQNNRENISRDKLLQGITSAERTAFQEISSNLISPNTSTKRSSNLFSPNTSTESFKKERIHLKEQQKNMLVPGAKQDSNNILNKNIHTSFTVVKIKNSEIIQERSFQKPDSRTACSYEFLSSKSKSRSSPLKRYNLRLKRI